MSQCVTLGIYLKHSKDEKQDFFRQIYKDAKLA